MGTENDYVERNINAIKCDCGGYAERVICTKEEIESDKNCGKSYECCVRAFVCCICKKRIIKTAEAPDIDIDNE